MKKILITGANGFVGRHCYKYFQNNNEIFAIDLNGTPFKNFIIGDVTIENMQRFNQKFDLIIHLAGSGIVSAAANNPDGEKKKVVNSLQNVLEYIKNYNPEARLILASSASVYGDKYSDKIKEEFEPAPVSLYGEHKLQSEIMCKEYADKFGLDVKVIRFFSLYGIGNKKQLLYDVLNRIKSTKSKTLSCFGTGNEKRDFINILDAVRFIDIVSNIEKGFDIYNCGSGNTYTVNEITNLLIKNSGKNIKQLYDNKKRTGNPDSLLADITKAKSIGFEPQISIEEGISDYVKWYKNIYKVYFPIHTNEQWLGGVNYFKNLFQALSMLENLPVEIYIPEDNPEILFKYARPVNENISIKKDFNYKLTKVLTILKGKNFDKAAYAKSIFLKDYDLVSHVRFFNYNDTPITSWIPDFQHIHLKEFFSENEIVMRDEYFADCAQKSNVVILSSNCAKNDFTKLFPDYAQKAKVLNFVSCINPEIYDITDNKRDDIIEKLKLPSKYFYVPNQFWQHKNHITVFKAVKLLKDKGINVKIVCSGSTEDYRNMNFYNDTILKYIEENNLQENIQILGIIDIDEVYYLMRNCISIINPSLFEGWSSTVEEAKSLGKNIILSDLDVHKEQNPPNARFFSRLNYEELADIMEENWNNLSSGPDYELEKSAQENMYARMIEFGKNYLQIVKEIVANKRGGNG